MPPGSILLLLAAISAAAIGHAGVRAVEHLAARGHFLDQPGAHRMHASPVPRGAGIGIPVALFLIGLLPNMAFPQVAQWQLTAALLAAAVALVATVGWIDDHGELAVSARLVAHLAAAGCVALGCWVADMAQTPWTFVLGALVVIAVTASINLHNFFDGADGLLASQALFGLALLAGLCLRAGHLPLAIIAVGASGAIAGFLPHNAPRARVFMGDAGSGTIGLALAAVGALAVRDLVLSLPMLLLIVSGCLIDTGMTLAARVLRRERFWERHQDHLYQWLIRGGWSHAQVASAWFAWSLVVVVPAIFLSLRDPERSGTVAIIVYALGMSIWILARHRLRLRAENAR